MRPTTRSASGRNLWRSAAVMAHLLRCGLLNRAPPSGTGGLTSDETPLGAGPGARRSLPVAAGQDAPRFPQRLLELGEPARPLDLMEQVVDRALQPDQHAGPVTARRLRRGRPLQPPRDRPAALLRRSSASSLGSGPAGAGLRASRRLLARPDARPRLPLGRALARQPQILADLADQAGADRPLVPGRPPRRGDRLRPGVGVVHEVFLQEHRLPLVLL